MKYITIFILSSSVFSCQTFNSFTKTQKVITAALATGAVGYLAGTSANADSTNKNAYGTMYMGLGSAAGAIGGTLFYDDTPQESKNLLEENKRLVEEVKKYEKQFAPELISEGTGLNEQPLPDEAKKLIKQGKWQKFKLNRWVQDSEDPNTYIKQVEMYKFTPPSIGEE